MRIKFCVRLKEEVVNKLIEESVKEDISVSRIIENILIKRYKKEGRK
jgi:predicted HicB family RNase H-like nuclease